jgi:hypothetical protein
MIRPEESLGPREGHGQRVGGEVGKPRYRQSSMI